MAIRRVVLLFLFCLLLFSISVMGYDNFIIHPRLTSKAVETYNKLGKTKLNSQETNWIIQGSIAEDADPRYLNHFYNPITGKGLEDGFFSGKSAKEWVHNQKNIVGISGDYSESIIFDNYLKGDYVRAYQGIGHILHLIQDMSVPAHTRNDAHPEGDPYEAWAKKNGNVVSNNEYIYVNNLDNAFDNLSRYTNGNFLSKDTVVLNNIIGIKIKEISNNNIRYKFLVKTTNGIDHLYSLYDDSSIVPVAKINDNFILNQDYWRMLYPKAIGYSAGVIDYFIREFNEIDKAREKTSLLELFKERFMMSWKNISYILGDTLIATHKVTNILSDGYEDFYQYANEVTGGRVLGAITTDDLFMPKEADADESGFITPTAQVAEPAQAVITPPEPSIPKPIELSLEIKEEESNNQEGVGVARVIDGDTIELTNGEKIRYIGVDTPELGKEGEDDDECLAWVARLRNMELLEKGELKIVKDSMADKDRYGRLLRYVYVNDLFINSILAKEGLAKTFFCEASWKNCPPTSNNEQKQEILLASRFAKENKLGLFSGVCDKERITENTEDYEDTENNENTDNNEGTEGKEVNLLEKLSFVPPSGGGTSSSMNEEDKEESAPIISLFEIYDLTSSSTEMTNDVNVGINLDVSNKESVGGYFLSASSTTPELSNEDWETDFPDNYILLGEDGKKDVYLWIKYGEGNDLIATSSDIILDTTALEVVFNKTPEKFSSSTSAIFEYSANKDNVNLEFKLDDESWSFGGISTASTTVNSLSETEHNFFIKGENLLAEINNSSYSWVVDLSAPTSALEALNSTYPEIGFNVSWSGSDASSTIKTSGLDTYDLQYKVKDNDWQDWINATTSTEAIFEVNLSDDDIIYFHSRARDKAGNLGEWSEMASTILSSSGIARHVVISEIQLSATSTTDEFIELYNPTDTSINLDGYRLSKKSSSGNEYTLVSSFPNVPIESKSYFLITHPNDYTGDITSDLVYSNSQSIASNNTIILYSDAGTTVIDKVGFGSASDFEINVYPSNPGDNESLIRKASASSTLALLLSGSEEWEGNGYDSNDNSYDFLSASSSPQNSYSAIEPRVMAPTISNKITDLSLVRGATTKTSIKLNLTTTSDNNKGAGAYYDLRYKVKSGDCDLNIDWNNAILVASSSLPVPSSSSRDTHELEITGLTLNTTYCFALKIFNSEDWSVLSNQTSATTSKNDIIVDSTTSTYSIWNNNLNWSHTVLGDNRLLVVPVSWRGKNYVINSIKYGLDDLSLAVEEIGANSGIRTSIYYLVNPPVGTDSINIDFSVSTYCGASAISLNSVDTNNPISTTTSRYAQGTSIYSTVDLDMNGMMIDSFSLKADLWIVTVNNLQIEIFNQDIGDIMFSLHAGSSYRNVASQGVYEMSWDITNSLIWSQAIVVINPL